MPSGYQKHDLNLSIRSDTGCRLERCGLWFSLTAVAPSCKIDLIVLWDTTRLLLNDVPSIIYQVVLTGCNEA